MYATPYYLTHKAPAVLICLVNPGNPYPVVENKNDAANLCGTPVKPGYQSNYVLTTKAGKIWDVANSSENPYDEVVIPQETQIMPIFLLELNYDACVRVGASFQRDISGIMGNKTDSLYDTVSSAALSGTFSPTSEATADFPIGQASNVPYLALQDKIK